jgi:hypothetical protein
MGSLLGNAMSFEVGIGGLWEIDEVSVCLLFEC